MLNKRVSFHLIAVLAIALLAAACGGSDDDVVTASEAEAATAVPATDGDAAEEPEEEAQPEPEPDEEPEAEPSSNGSDQEVIDAVVAQLDVEAEFPPGTDIDCLAAAMVQGLGGAEVMEAEYGLTVETIADGSDINDVELPKDQAISMADGMFACGLMDLMVGEMTGDGLGETEARCLAESIDQSILRDVVASELMNEADALEVAAEAEANIMPSLFGAMATCEIDPTSLTG